MSWANVQDSGQAGADNFEANSEASSAEREVEEFFAQVEAEKTERDAAATERVKAEIAKWNTHVGFDRVEEFCLAVHAAAHDEGEPRVSSRLL